MKFIGKFDGAIAQALDEINEKYDGNVTFNRCDLVKGRRDGREEWEVTLKTRSSSGPGAGRALPHDGKSRRLPTACWHVHGDFLDALGRLCPEAEYESTINGRQRILVCEHGWQDKMLGGMYTGFHMMSDLCECEEE